MKIELINFNGVPGNYYKSNDETRELVSCDPRFATHLCLTSKDSDGFCQFAECGPPSDLVKIIDPKGVAKDKVFVLRFKDGEEFGTFYYCDVKKINMACGIRGDFVLDSSGCTETEDLLPFIIANKANGNTQTIGLDEILLS